MCDLRPYQKQAFFWMSEAEKGIDVEKAAKTLHPCWAAYRICDECVFQVKYKTKGGLEHILVNLQCVDPLLLIIAGGPHQSM